MDRGKVVPFIRPRSRRRRIRSTTRFAALGLALGIAGGVALLHPSRTAVVGDAATAAAGTDPGFACPAPSVIDGDTLDCGQTRVRLSGIDAPELPGHCRPGRQCTPGDPWASTENLRSLVASASVTCRETDTDVYGRTVAICQAGTRDLSCAQVAGGFAVRRYAPLSC